MRAEDYPDLTRKEQQILRLLAEGWNGVEICRRLVISKNTFKKHTKSLRVKFGVHRHSLEDLDPSEESDPLEDFDPSEGSDALSKPVLKLVKRATLMGYLPTPRYSLEKKSMQLSNEHVEIYRASQTFHGYGADKEIFYKRLVNESSGEIQRFKHEVDVLSRVKHDNILDLHDYGRDYGWDEKGCLFFTLPYHANLKNILMACKDAPEKIDNFLLQLLNVLGYLHWRRIIFNNLLPQNIFVADGKVLLVDFRNSILLNKTSSSAGINEERKAVRDSQASEDSDFIQRDFLGLGVLIYQMLTSDQHNLGSKPLTPEVAEQMVYELRQRPADRAMARIVGRLLSVKGENCFQSAFEVTEALLRTKKGRFDQNRAFSKWVKGFSRMEPIGRDEDLNQLKSALRQLFEARKGGMYLIVGEAGVGKSALLKQIRREARGFDQPEAILSYFKIENKSSVNRGYTMWRDILLRLIEAAEMTGITGETALAIRSLQKLLEPSSETTPVIKSDGRTEQAALHLFRTLKAKKGIKNKVVLLLLDDLQLMGDDSYRLLHKLHQDIVRLNLPVLIIGSYKELDPNEGRTLNDLSRGPRGRKLPSTPLIKIAKLNQESSRQLSHHLLSTLNLQNNLYQVELDQLTQIISEKSRGFPLRVMRYVQVAAQYDRLDAIKAELDQIWSSEDAADDEVVTWLQRNKHLNDQSRLFLATLAIIGIRVDIKLLKKIYSNEKALKSLLYACYDAGVLIEDNQQIKFLHDSVHDAALKFLPEKAEKIYETIALAIEELYRSNLIVYYSQLADLWDKANNRQLAASYYLKAATFEINKSAYSSAQEHVKRFSDRDWQAELERPEKAEVELIKYFAHMGLGEVHSALQSARNALDLLGNKIVKDSPFGLELTQSFLRQIWYRLRGGKIHPKKTMDLKEFLIAVRCYRALTQLEYFNNNFSHVFYYLMEGLNLCDEVGNDGRGQKADIYAAATIVVSQLGSGITRKLIASQYEILAQDDLEKSGDKALELWMRLVLGMYYCSIGKWNTAKEHLERGMHLGAEGFDQRRRYEVVAILYLCLSYCGEWEDAQSKNNYLRGLVRDDKVDLDSLSQTDLWPPLFDCDKYLYTGEFEQGVSVLEKICPELAELDRAAWLRGIGVLAQVYLRSGERSKAEAAANDFLDNIRGKPVMPFYATEGFFGALEVFLELLKNEGNSKDRRNKAKELLYYLLDQPILAFSKRYPIARPRALLYRARYIFITKSRKYEAERWANLALQHAQELKMRYDEGLILEFIGGTLNSQGSGRDDLEKASFIFNQLGARWNRDQVGEKLK